MSCQIIMKYVAYQPPGGIDTLQLAETEIPRPGPGEVLIKVAYAGVNGPDIVQRKGLYPPPPDASPILGLEVSGHIEALGEGVSDWSVGDAVTALTPGGGYAEYCVTPAGWVLPPPPGMSLADAAGLPEVWFTVWANLVQMGRINTGAHVLVHGGAGGVGSAAIQLARYLGATVFTTETGSDKLEYCKKLGATAAFDYKTQDFEKEIRALTGKRGVDIVLDIIGGSYFQKSLNLLARGGRLLVVAFNRGSRFEVDMMSVLTRRLTISGSTLRSRTNEEKTDIRDELLHQLWTPFVLGQLHTRTHAVVPLAQASEAHRMMESAEHIGKIVLQVA